MKKIYTLALASLTMLSSYAAGFERTTNLTPRANRSVVGMQKSITMPEAQSFRAPASIGDVTIDDITSLDTFKFYGYMEDFYPGAQSIPLQMTVTDLATGSLTLKLYGEFNVKATFDPNTCTVSIPTGQLLGADSFGELYFYTKDLPADGNFYNGSNGAVAAVGTWDGKSIKFTPDEVWAIGDPDNEQFGWMVLSSENEFTKDNSVKLTGSFNENMLYPSFIYDQTTDKGIENTEFVTVNITSDGAGTYTVQNPLQSLYKALNYSPVSPDMVIDATDPNNVKVPMAQSGLTDSGSSFVYFNEGWFCEEYAEGADACPEELRATMTVDEDHNVTITFPVFSTTIWAYPTQDFYTASEYVSTLKFNDPTAAVGTITAADSNAPVRYYNLQGMEVNNPEAGTIVIRVQGSKAVKEIAK